jgi:copper oxidase (laccase) domain-containing protein
MSWITPEWPSPKNIRACITSRTGGNSLAPDASNNLGLHVGDNPECVQRNRQQLCTALG